MAAGSDAFGVVLNAEGTRRVRGWRHVEGCDQCVGQTAEYSLEDIGRRGLT